MIVSYIATSTLDADTLQDDIDSLQTWEADGIIQTNATSFESPTEGKRKLSPLTP